MKVSSVRNLYPIYDGQGVVMTRHFVLYGSSTSGTVKPTVWVETVPEVAQGNYLWTKTYIEYSDGNKSEFYSVSRIGIDGKGITSSEVTYAIMQNPVAPESITSWGSFPTTLTDGYWLYTRTILTYSDKAKTTSYSVSQVGTGAYYAGVVEYYSASASDTAPVAAAPTPGTYANGETIAIADQWTQGRPALSAATPYLWNFEISADSRGNRYVTPAICIGNFSKGIISIVETYCISAYGKPNGGQPYPTDCTSWTDEHQDAAPTDEKPYQWNRTQTTYNDHSVEYHYHVSAVKGDRGGNGADGAQPNLFGMRNYVGMGTDGVWMAMHTATGFVAMFKVDSRGATFVNIFRGTYGEKMFEPGIYSVSCRVRFTNVMGLSGTFSVQGTMERGRLAAGSNSLVKSDGTVASAVQSGVDYTLRYKYNLTSEYFPYFYIFGVQGSDVYLMMEVSDLKIERTDGIAGVCTAFCGLAEDSRPVMPNILDDTYKVGTASKWNVLNGVRAEKALSGCTSVRSSNGGSADYELLEQLIPDGVLKGNTCYTLSFYAKCSGTCYAYCYPGVTGVSENGCAQSIQQLTDYPWVENGGWLEPSAKGINSAGSIMKVTLTNSKSTAVTETVRVEGSSESNWDFFYISESLLEKYSDVKASTTCIDKRSGAASSGTVSIPVPANSSKVIYIGYVKDSSGNVGDDSYRVLIGKFVAGVMVADGKKVEATSDCRFAIPNSNEWVRHTLTFWTSPNISGEKRVLWRICSGGSLEIAMMKLEQGDGATPWSANEGDRRGESGTGFNIMSWTDNIKTGAWMYFSKYELTSDIAVADIVIYNSFYYVCIKGYTAVPSSPTPDRDEEHWKVFDKNFQNVATDILISNAINTKILEAVNARVNELVLNRAVAKDSGNNTTLTIDGASGKLTAKSADISGVIRATSVYMSTLYINNVCSFYGDYYIDLINSPYCEYYGVGYIKVHLPPITSTMYGMEISISSYALSRQEGSLSVVASDKQRIYGYNNTEEFGIGGKYLVVSGNTIKLKAFTDSTYANGVWRIISSIKSITSTILRESE